MLGLAFGTLASIDAKSVLNILNVLGIESLAGDLQRY